VTDALVAVGTDAFRFVTAEVVAAAGERWPGTVFVPSSGELVAYTDGQLRVPVAEGAPDVLAELHPDGRGIGLEGTVEGISQVVAWVTERPGFPSDGSVLLLGWNGDYLPLDPGTTPARLEAQYDEEARRRRDSAY
jgi:hypothetical protein